MSDGALALEHEIVTFDLEPDADPPKVLVKGPDSAGNLFEVTAPAASEPVISSARSARIAYLGEGAYIGSSVLPDSARS